MHLIGINGFKQSGKGTVAGILSALYGDGEGVVYEIGFADKLKIMAATAFGFDRPPRDLIALMDEAKLSWDIDVWTPETAVGPWHTLTGREYLQHFGNGARNIFGDTFWIDQVLPRPAAKGPGPYDPDQRSLRDMYPEPIDAVAITDLRYPNEAERVLALGGVVWEVTRPGVGSDGHASEQPLPRHLVSHTIDNSGDLHALEREVERAMDATL